MTCFSCRKVLIHAGHNHHDADGECPPRGMFNEPWEREWRAWNTRRSNGLKIQGSPSVIMGLKDISERRSCLGTFLIAQGLSSHVPRTP